MSAAGIKRCVFCGGDDHPAECGQPDETPTPWIAFGLAILVVAALVLELLL